MENQTALLLATHNQGKLRELRDMLPADRFPTTTLAQLGIGEAPEETGETFRANAELKARHYAAAANLWTLADDSGLEVDGLGGRPGVRSSRYGGPGLDDRGRLELLLEELGRDPAAARTARFRCVIALSDPGGARIVHHTEGVVEGRITAAPRGAGGFGYDPIFEVPELGVTTAEMSAVEKGRISHRGRALRGMVAHILEHGLNG